MSGAALLSAKELWAIEITARGSGERVIVINQHNGTPMVFTRREYAESEMEAPVYGGLDAKIVRYRQSSDMKKERPMRYEPNDPVRLEAETRALLIYYATILARLPSGHRHDTSEHTRRHREEIVAELAAELLIFHSKGCDCRPDNTPAPAMRRVEARRI